MSLMEIPTKFVEKVKFVQTIFTDVETEYDRLLHLMTLTFDSVWRNRMLSKIDFRQEIRVLDLACGTGLVTFELGRRARPGSIVVGLDLSPAMLSVAKRKNTTSQSNCSIELVRAVGESLPFREGFFSYVTVGLALRNFANKLAVFKESRQVLMESGRFFSVDFVHPDSNTVWLIYRFHIFHVLPALGRIVSTYWNRTLIYLANTILISTRTQEICKLLDESGFRGTLVEKMSLGIVALIGAHK
jgi:demethylmenaquinone methyltransferase/2-methoxy-6-polyprenyl-1,4-benzoquinol methylase